MPQDTSISRRRFLQSAGTLTGVAYARLAGASLIALAESACTARDEAADFKTVTNDEASTLEAIAARIIPTTDTPGANEAGVIYFIDNVLGNIMQDKLDGIRAGLADFNAALAEAHSGTAFESLADDQQDAFLKTRDKSDFFAMLRMLTIYGFFSMGKYGGNKDNVGWELIGFKGHQGAWQYPFGHYDAEVHGEKLDDE